METNGIRYFFNNREINLDDLTEEENIVASMSIEDEIASVEKTENDVRMESLRLVDGKPEVAAAKARLADRLRDRIAQLRSEGGS